MKTRVDEPVDDRRERRERLVPLAVRQHERLELAGRASARCTAARYRGATTSFVTTRICFAAVP